MSKHKINLQKVLTTVLFGLLLYCCFWLWDTLTIVRLPQSNRPVELYANQIRDDLAKTLVASIDGAKKSVLLVNYSLTDQGVISSLRKKSEEGIDVTVVCDAKASPYAHKKLGPTVKTRR